MPIAPSEKPSAAVPFQPGTDGGQVVVVQDFDGNPVYSYFDDSGAPPHFFDGAVKLNSGGQLKSSTFTLLTSTGNDPGDIVGTFNSGRLTAVGAATTATGVPSLNQLSPVATITSGALPTQQFVSGTAAQVSTTRDVEVHTPVTFNPGVATTATCKVELSPDNTTYSTLCTWTEPVGVALDGTILDVTCRVPAGWYLKLTVNAQAVLGLSTFY